MVGGEKEGKIMSGNGALPTGRNETPVRNSRTLNEEASKSSVFSPAVENRFMAMINGEMCLGEQEGSGVDSELNEKDAFLKMVCPESLDGDARALNKEASKMFTVFIDGILYYGGNVTFDVDGGGLEDSELNNASSLLQSKKTHDVNDEMEIENVVASHDAPHIVDVDDGQTDFSDDKIGSNDVMDGTEGYHGGGTANSGEDDGGRGDSELNEKDAFLKKISLESLDGDARALNKEVSKRFMVVIDGKLYYGGNVTCGAEEGGLEDSELNNASSLLESIKTVDVNDEMETKNVVASRAAGETDIGDKTGSNDAMNGIEGYNGGENAKSGEEEGGRGDSEFDDKVVFSKTAEDGGNQFINVGNVSSGEEGALGDLRPCDSVGKKIEQMEMESVVSSHAAPPIVDADAETDKIDEKEKTDFGSKIDKGDQECEFSVGDFVWGKTRSNTSTWCPGQIYDPNDASDNAAKLTQKDRLLVAYFNGSFAWCHSSQLKPFEQNFIEFSKLSTSMNSQNAIQTSVNEISRLVELKMTCPCVSKKRYSELNRPLAENSGIKQGALVPDRRVGKLLIGLFKPNQVLGKLKHIAQVISTSSSLDSIVLKGWLQAFYSAKGYSQLPLYREPEVISGLEGSDDYNNAMNVSNRRPNQEDWLKSGCKFRRIGDIVTQGKQKSGENLTVVTNSGKSDSSCKRKNKRNGSDEEVQDVSFPENGVSTRERKKSKYLSPPYTNSGSRKRRPPLDDSSQFSYIEDKLNMLITMLDETESENENLKTRLLDELNDLKEKVKLIVSSP